MKNKKKDMSMSGKHSPLGELKVESSVTDVSSGIAKERKLGVSMPSAKRRTLKPERK